MLGEAFYTANDDHLRHKATQTDFRVNFNATQQKKILKSHFSSFAIKQHWQLMEVEVSELHYIK